MPCGTVELLWGSLNCDVTVIDSSFTDQAMKFKLLKPQTTKGKNLETILKAHVEDVKNHTELYIGVSDINLVKEWSYWTCDRITKRSLLNIDVVMQMKNLHEHSITNHEGCGQSDLNRPCSF